ncbi:hypothetical protein Syun_011713 [Stephania yunnanensis]|uniref:Epidermal patterning factor-like protein n=1 Tax=Stephania yunnanensis TaxID=152371 RepID=A0AAP0PEL3_9MAGN
MPFEHTVKFKGFNKTKRMCSVAVAVAVLQLLCLVTATTSRPFALQGLNQQAVELNKDIERVVKSSEGEYRGVSTLGSRPPNCEHRCGGCIPCEAIQVPTTTDRLGVQYANYEPEGWKCKCGSKFFNP